MGKAAKSSRKGKKAWRANIATDDIDEYFEKSTKDALSGGSLAAVPSDSLFYLDKSTDLSVKKKIDKHREKVLRVESVLQSNPFVIPIPSSVLKKGKKKKKQAKVESSQDVAADMQQDKQDKESEVLDLWNDKGEDNVNRPKISKPSSAIPAVEVDPLGCSFNPDFEAHQNSLACAVAEEMQKIYKDELGPQPVPLTVPGEVVDEEDMYFLDADDATDDQDEKLDENSDTATEKRLSKSKPVTRVELNRRVRRKEQLKAEAEAKKGKKVTKQIDSIPDILDEIAKEDEEKQRKHDRRVIAKQERLKSAPPRLGRFKFEPAPPQVLLTEEISGSLRKLKGCSTLARDRFKSYEKRGILVPSAKRRRK